MPNHHIISSGTVRAMWNNWAIAFGALSLVILCSLFISKLWLPLVLFAGAYLLSARLKFESGRTKIMGCNLIVWTMVWVLVWSAIAMCVINILYAKWFVSGVHPIDPINPKHPYVCSLILFPISAVLSVYMLLRRRHGTHCRRCLSRFGYYSTSDPVAALYYRETRYQLRLLLWLSLLLSVVDWFYYFKFYINVNYNSPDRFFYIFFPVAVYVASLVYMAIRYMSMVETLSSRRGKATARPVMSLVRYLVFSGDAVYLETDAEGMIDTPAQMMMPRREEMTPEDAGRFFGDISGSDDFELKYLYTDTGFATGANVFHFAAFMPEDMRDLSLRGTWITIDELDRQLKSRNLAPMLLGEINRIYRVTMAWKTYDRDGRRLYPIKNYQPTFRFRDLKGWSVDYNDLSWLDIAANNEDRPFYRLRRFWQKNFRH